MTVLKHSQIEQTNKTPDLKLLRKNLFNSANNNIKVEGVGFGAKQDVAIIHSELGALVAEQFKDRDTSYSIKDLLFQTRKEPEKLLAMPEYHENLNYSEGLTGTVQETFNE